jgi:class 3 adenylate cyclase
MNLFFKSYKVYLIFLLFISCESSFCRAKAQDRQLHLLPWIQEVKLPSLYPDFPYQSMHQNQQGILFLGKENGLLILQGQKVDHIPLPGPVFVAGESSDTLFYAAENDMGFLIRDKESEFRALSRKHLVPASQRTFIPSGIIRHQEQVYISSDRGLYRLNTGRVRFTPFPVPLTKMGIEQEGLCFLTEDSERLRWTGETFLAAPDSAATEVHPWSHLSVHSGIVPENIVQVFKRNNRETWILSPFTLHKICDPSPLGILETDPSGTGLILASHVVDEGIILGTNRGLYELHQPELPSENWKLRACFPTGHTEAVHLFSSAGPTVFAAGQNYLYSFSSDQADEAHIIDQGKFTGLQALGRDTLLVSGGMGLMLYHWDSKQWNATLIDPSLRLSHSFVKLGDEVFFLCSNGVYKLRDSMAKAVAVQFHTDDLLQKLELADGELLVHGIEQVYRHVKSEDTFLPLMDQDKNRFLNPASYPVLNALGEIIQMDLRDSILILTGTTKVSFLDLEALDQELEQLALNIVLDFLSERDVSILLSGMDFQYDPEPLFRFSLSRVQEAWSPWTTGRNLVFNKLKAGKYTFEAEGMDLFGNITELASLEFVIRPPFYKSWYAYVSYSLLFLILLFLLRKWQMLSLQRVEFRISQRIQSKVQDLTREKEKSDKLVADVSPQQTASQLKAVGKAKWDKYERATVLFSDIQGFTKIAEEMNPEALIDELDQFFFHFDSVVEKYNIEKIKTIGDAYMAAGGIPKKNSTNPVEVVLAALEMQSYMQQLKSSKADIWDLRIGIHTGPVIAGVVGHKKVSYDIWGDTVNTASRMESSGEPGRVNISGITYGMVKDYFLCEYRGKLPVKYKGKIDMYFVNGLRPELAVDLKGIPNKRFFTKLQLLRLGDLEDVVFGSLLNNLNEHLYFHKLEHAQKVYNQAFLLCRAEEVDQYDRLLIRTAALFLFTGLTQSHANFENRSAVICREILPEYQYSESQIDQVCNLILATKMPFNPRNHLEKVVIDARMDYIGRPDFTTRIKLFFQELLETGAKINGQQFKHQQLELLYNFEFFTLAGQRLREVKSAEQMATLEQERWI